MYVFFVAIKLPLYSVKKTTTKLLKFSGIGALLKRAIGCRDYNVHPRVKDLSSFTSYKAAWSFPLILEKIFKGHFTIYTERNIFFASREMAYKAVGK